MRQKPFYLSVKLLQSFFLIFFVFIFNLTHSQTYPLPGAPALTEAFNQVSSIGFDFAGNPISKSKGYFNSMGKRLQSQSWDVLTNKVWGSVSLYDRHGRPVLQTLSAPIGTIMIYSYDFIKNGSGVSYGLSDFDIGSSVSNPSPVSPTSPLGSYYSSSNTLNPYQDVTSYPFVRRAYSRLDPGAVQRVLGGNKIDGEWKQSYSFSMPAGNNLEWNYPGTEAFKTIYRDVHDNEVVVFTDRDGNTLASGRVTDDIEFETMVDLYISPDQGYIDVHLGKDISTLSIGNFDTQYGGSLKIYDLVNETLFTMVTSNGSISSFPLSSGFYRIAVDDPSSYSLVTNPINVRHLVRYIDLSYNKYDKVGRLASSTQPTGFYSSNNGMSTFKYNSLGQLLEATSPDEGTAKFLYRTDGQIRFSQNSKQALTGAFSYTHYDSFGRPVESGVYQGSITFAQAAAMVDYPNPLAEADCSEIHRTTYDLPDFDQYLDEINECGLPVSNYRQTFVAGNVSMTTTKNPYTSTTWYSYDVLGRVTWMAQEIEGMPCYKTIDYTYSPQTGQVVKVDYQRHKADERFIHKYDYNPAGQLVAVHTSRDNISYSEQAAYHYAESGELVRTVLAEDLQGIDYVYNLNGQLKAINHPSLDPAKDPGQDGTTGSNVAADVFGFAIDYYSGDYARANTPTPVPQQNTHGTDQYNGNIKGVRFNTQGQPASGGDFNAYMYGYNTNNWLATADFGSGSEQPQGGGQYSVNFTPNSNGDYGVSIPNYDANGNIKSLARKGYTDSNGTNDMDAFTYHYSGNKLLYVEDTGDNTDPSRYDDLKDQSNNGAANYLYNEIGQLVTDVAGKAIYEYNASGLVTRIRTFGEGGNGQQPKQIYNQDFQTATSLELNTWTLTSGSKGINYAGTYSADGTTNLCAYLGNTYERSLRLSMPHNATARRDYPVIAGIAHSLSLDVIADQWREGAPSGQQQTPVGYVIEVLNGDAFSGTLNPAPLATVSYNTALDYITDPDMSGTACSKFYDQSHTLDFTPTGNKVIFRIKKLTTAGSEPIYLDNVYMEAATIPVVDIAYNDRGHRVRKTAYNLSNGYKSHTYYVRDASGTVLSIYNSTDTSKKGVPKQSELPVYGASRLGVLKMGTAVSDPPTPDTYLYELTDHLGNVRAVIGKTSGGIPYVVARTDYYPFGMPMPNRNVDGQYRYAFQGQEKDPETGMEAFQLRLWDSRIGRWLTPDPYAQYHSPYLGMGNNPINGIDPDGGCFTTDADGNTIPCPDMGVGSTMMGNAGYEWTMQSDGWARSDGYSVNIYGVGKNAPVKVLTELDGLGHTYIQIGDNLLFTNGRYNGSDSPSMGEYGLTGDNVLLRKTGIEVQNFLAERTEKYPTLVQTVENVDASKIYSNLNSRYNAGSPNPNGPGVIDGKYNLLLSNCTTSTSVALKAGGANVHAIAPKALPLQINLHNQGIDPQKYFQAARFEALRGPKL